MTPLGHHQRSRQAAQHAQQQQQQQPATPAGGRPREQQGVQQPAGPPGASRGSPSKPTRLSVRASAPVFGGYGGAALTPLAPLPELQRPQRGPSVGNSVASTVHRREGSGADGSEPGGLRASGSGTLRLSREASGAMLSAQPSGGLSTLPSSVLTEPHGSEAGGYPSLRPLEVEALVDELAACHEAAAQETPAPTRRGASDLIELNSAGRPGPCAPNASTPSTDEKVSSWGRAALLGLLHRWAPPQAHGRGAWGAICLPAHSPGAPSSAPRPLAE